MRCNLSFVFNLLIFKCILRILAKPLCYLARNSASGYNFARFLPGFIKMIFESQAVKPKTQVSKLRNFTLIEIVLSLFLLSLALTSLFCFYTSSQREKQVLDRAFASVQEEHFCHLRLQKILQSTFTPPHFGSDGNELIFTFDHGIDAEPLLSHQVLAKLYLDKKTETLCLGIWPFSKNTLEPPKKSPSKTFLLLANVKALEFEFYWPLKKTQIVNTEDVGPLTPPAGWSALWPCEYYALPAMIKLTLTRAEDKKVFVYFLEKSTQSFVYRCTPSSS